MFLSSNLNLFGKENMSPCTKNKSNYKYRTFRDIFGQLLKQENKATKKEIVRLQLNEK